jgi:hypothetical protein
VSTDPAGGASEESTVGERATVSDAQDQLSEEDRSEIDQRAAYEAEIARVTSADMILQATVSLLNIGGHRLGLSSDREQPAGGARDLEQVRDAIDGARALLPILERRQPNELRPLRDALSQLQMAYAREAGTTAPADPAVAQGVPAAAKRDAPAAAQDASAAAEKPDGPGPAESSGRLWVPGR